MGVSSFFAVMQHFVLCKSSVEAFEKVGMFTDEAACKEGVQRFALQRVRPDLAAQALILDDPSGNHVVGQERVQTSGHEHEEEGFRVLGRPCDVIAVFFEIFQHVSANKTADPGLCLEIGCGRVQGRVMQQKPGPALGCQHLRRRVEHHSFVVEGGGEESVHEIVSGQGLRPRPWHDDDAQLKAASGDSETDALDSVSREDVGRVVIPVGREFVRGQGDRFGQGAGREQQEGQEEQRGLNGL